ncbi:MAG: 3-phosphoshikimate 1-carboxyvinyltransferase, partial [Anaerolineae bacterium]|nr:3-phosphoshikimate 1-carboxyvinyltransferase [Anaerolineae bacterium]
GILAGQSFTSILDGHTGLRRRPMERVAVPLRAMGAMVMTQNGRPPLTITGGNLGGIEYHLP